MRIEGESERLEGESFLYAPQFVLYVCHSHISLS